MSHETGSYHFENNGKRNPYDQRKLFQKIASAPVEFISDLKNRGTNHGEIFLQLNVVRKEVQEIGELFFIENPSFAKFCGLRNSQPEYFTEVFKLFWQAGFSLQEIKTFSENLILDTVNNNEQQGLITVVLQEAMRQFENQLGSKDN